MGFDNRNLRLLVCALALVAVCGAPALGQDPQAARKGIEAVNAAIGRAFDNQDAAAFARHYTEDGAVLPPDAPMIRGRKQIETFWKDVMAGGVTGASLETLEVENLGDTAWERGIVTLTIEPAGEAAVTQRAKYIVVWKRQGDGAWKLHRDIWNALPAAGTE